MGGFNGKSLNNVEKYDSLGKKWEKYNPMLFERCIHTAVLVKFKSSEDKILNI